MAEELIGSANEAGSPNNYSGPADNSGAGEPAKPEVNLEDYVSKTQYEELESKLGEQGNELGSYREFYNQIAPVLDKLESQPDLVKAIMDDKIDSSLAKAALEGKIGIKEAQVVTQAHAEVKKDLGTKQYNAMTPEDIEDLIERKLQETIKPVSAAVDAKLEDAEKLRNYENSINEFINSTPDFPEFADRITKWFNTHPEQDDIRIAYDAVKGKAIQEWHTKDQAKSEAELKKEMALNAGGGSGMGSGTIDDGTLVDKLIGNISNPNSF